MNWKYYFIIGFCFGLAIIVEYLISGHSILRYITNLVPSALVILVVGGVAKFIGVDGIIYVREYLEERNEKKRDHSQKLVDKKLKSITNTHVSSYDKSLELYINGQRSSGKTYDDYSIEIKTHLEKGYSEILAHKTKCNSIIDNHNNLAKLFLDFTNGKILKEVNERNLSLIKWNLEEPTPINYFIPEYLFADVEDIIKSSYERFFDIDRYCVISLNDIDLKSYNNNNLLVNIIIDSYPERFKRKLKIHHHFAEGDMNDIKTLKQIIKEIVVDALKNDDFNTLRKYKTDAVNEYNLFLNGIHEIIKSVENGTPLEGKCNICEKY